MQPRHVMLWVCMLVNVCSVLCMTPQARAERPAYDEPTLLRHWAMARCVMQAYEDGPMRKDAAASAAGYLEFGSSDLEVYEAIDALVSAQLHKTYRSKSGEKMQMMKCLDLMHGKALERLIEDATRLKIG